MNAILTLRDVEIFKAGERLLGPLSADILAGRPLVLMGPSGSGKSTLLNWMIGALPEGFSARGHVLLNGQDITALPCQARRLGILFQDDLLFPHMSVGENLGFALRPGLDRESRRAQIAAALKEAELPGLEGRNPLTLSGGERARLALMRTLLAEPKAILLDEPFSKLDIALRARFRAFVLERAAIRNLPVLLVSHDPADSEGAGGRVLTLPSASGGGG